MGTGSNRVLVLVPGKKKGAQLTPRLSAGAVWAIKCTVTVYSDIHVGIFQSSIKIFSSKRCALPVSLVAVSMDTSIAGFMGHRRSPTLVAAHKLGGTP
jgi:hypothetical protein